MTGRRLSPQPCDECLLAGLQRVQRQAGRPSIVILLWRCRGELVLLAGLPAAVIVLDTQLSYGWIVVEAVMAAALLAIFLKARLWLHEHVRCAISATGPVHADCARVRNDPPHGGPRAKLLAGLEAFGERGPFRRRDGTCSPDFEPDSGMLGDVWADEVHVLQAPTDPPPRSDL